MKRTQLLSTVAAGLLLTTGAAFAQGMNKDANPAPAPSAQQGAPAEKTAPNMKAGEKNADTHKAPATTTGQAPAASDAGKGAADKPMNKGAADTGKNPAATTTGQNTAPASPNRAESPAATPKAGQTANDPAKSSTSTTTGQGSAAGAAKLSTEQRTKITTVFKQHRVEPAKLNVSISVGTRVPESVRYYPIPQDVVVIYPEWRGYNYILVGDQILVLDPRSHEIVAILDA
jgi:hypothetical protein